MSTSQAQGSADGIAADADHWKSPPAIQWWVLSINRANVKNRFFSTIIAGAAGGLLTFGGVFLFQKNLQTPESPQVSYSKKVNFGENMAAAPFDFTRAANKSMRL